LFCPISGGSSENMIGRRIIVETNFVPSGNGKRLLRASFGTMGN